MDDVRATSSSRAATRDRRWRPAAARARRLPGDRRRQRLQRRHGRRRPRPRRDGRHREPTGVRRRGARGARGGHGGVRRVHGRRRVLRPRRARTAARRRPLGARRHRGRSTSPGRTGVWPWHARAGNALVVAWLRHRIGMGAHDIAPMRVCRRQALLDLGVRDRAFGYPVELMQRAVAAGWRFAEHDVTYHPRAAGTRSKVSGSVSGHAAHRPRLRTGAVVTHAGCWWSPRRRSRPREDPPRRRGRHRRRGRARRRRPARHARARASTTVGVDRCRLALDGRPGRGDVRRPAGRALDGWQVFPQRGDGLAERLACSHLDLAAEEQGPVVQIGMDTPQVTEADLTEVIAGLDDHDAVLADAEDGGWWALALTDPRHGEHLVGVPMSTPTTGAATRAAFERAGLTVGRGRVLRDVDVAEDADAVAAVCADGSVFAGVWRRVRERRRGLGRGRCSATSSAGTPACSPGRRHPARRPGRRVDRDGSTVTRRSSTSARDRRWTSGAGLAG